MGGFTRFRKSINNTAVANVSINSVIESNEASNPPSNLNSEGNRNASLSSISNTSMVSSPIDSSVPHNNENDTNGGSPSNNEKLATDSDSIESSLHNFDSMILDLNIDPNFSSFDQLYCDKDVNTFNSIEYDRSTVSGFDHISGFDHLENAVDKKTQARDTESSHQVLGLNIFRNRKKPIDKERKEEELKEHAKEAYRNTSIASEEVNLGAAEKHHENDLQKEMSRGTQMAEETEDQLCSENEGMRFSSDDEMKGGCSTPAENIDILTDVSEGINQTVQHADSASVIVQSPLKFASNPYSSVPLEISDAATKYSNDIQTPSNPKHNHRNTALITGSSQTSTFVPNIPKVQEDILNDAETKNSMSTFALLDGAKEDSALKPAYDDGSRMPPPPSKKGQSKSFQSVSDHDIRTENWNVDGHDSGVSILKGYINATGQTTIASMITDTEPISQPVSSVQPSNTRIRVVPGLNQTPMKSRDDTVYPMPRLGVAITPSPTVIGPSVSMNHSRDMNSTETTIITSDSISAESSTPNISCEVPMDHKNSGDKEERFESFKLKFEKDIVESDDIWDRSDAELIELNVRLVMMDNMALRLHAAYGDLLEEMEQVLAS